MRNKTEHLAALHQLSAAEEAGCVRYGLSVHPAIVLAIKDRTLGHQSWASSYAAYAREQMGVTDGDQLYA
ncbi:hypothetical protein [Rhizobium leguminosarum]|uniref:hypothetical protein n=1 Tax=Rhizobium leguminosarum TaxID=384 RepID=UPI0010400412|nr:hypothetical protein [Rhizobium leguminosarum]TBZ81386.1 hypothetical protein E0H61_14680 [Rhizobium leguminosarum bv. viciae]